MVLLKEKKSFMAFRSGFSFLTYSLHKQLFLWRLLAADPRSSAGPASQQMLPASHLGMDQNNNKYLKTTYPQNIPKKSEFVALLFSYIFCFLFGGVLIVQE